MINKNMTLRNLFLIRVLLALLVIVLLSEAIQLYFINGQINDEVDKQSHIIAQNIKREIENTNLAAESLEHQIDLKLISYAKYTAEILKGKSIDDITNQDLLAVQKELGLAGITLFARKEDDIVGMRSTDPVEVGFSSKEFGFYETINMLLKGEKAVIEGATFLEKNMIVLPIAQSGSHQNEPVFFKYAYYHSPQASYIINPYIEADEVYQFLNEVGPSSSIAQMKTKNSYLDEVAILNPKVFVNPLLEQQLYPPAKKIVHGTFDYQSERDLKALKSMVNNPKKVSYIQQVNGKKLYKVFLPVEENQVIYMAFDYGEMSQPLIRQSILISLAGFISLLVLYLLTSNFFKRIYKNIDLLVGKVERISKGEYGLTAVSDGQYEFKKLTGSINQMSLSLHQSFEKLLNEKLFREQILASLPIGIITIHNQTNEIELNGKAKELTQLDAIEIKRICTEKVSCSVNTEFWNLLCSEEFFKTRKISFKISENTYKFLVSQSPLVDDNRKIIGRIFHFINVSEIDQLEKRVHRTEKLALVGELASGAAHEIKNPLAVIQGFIHLMNAELSEKERHKHHTSLILKEIERINKIVHDMLVLAKPSLNMKEASLDEVIAEIMPLLHMNYSSNTSIQVNLDQVTVYMDVNQMKQVFLNLIINSIQAINEKGEIHISSQLEQDKVHIFIEDNGKGVPEEIQANIFEPFVSSKEAGTGLGLTIIKQIVESHEGSIELVSSNNDGTVFKITLPLEEKGKQNP
ncbi:ATP-binding protein [Bacillus taeanensis]|uniref:histidine kinase n=1 Tax=Bacillus taeanensis TaxID=273032 RepID=A0A366XXC8_9BACI|nr:ATP-binding protein [Bacillus taeanensis]RBW68794.1 hypothetical protein DS031_14710 [Bacillus taeanensis]